MGNKGLWAALAERDALYAKPELTDEDGMRLGELEGIVGEEDGYTAESDAAILLQGLDIPDEFHERKMSELQGGQKVRVLLAQALFGKPQALLLDEPTNYSRSGFGPLAAGFSAAIRRHADHHLARSPLSEQRLHAHRRHRLRDHHHVHRRLRRHGAGEDADPLALESQNAQREKKIAQLNEFIARFSAGTRSSQVTSRKKEVERLQTTELARSNIQRPLHPLRHDSGPRASICWNSKSLSKAYDGLQVINGFQRGR